MTQAYLLFGTVADTPKGQPLNSAVLLTPAGDLVDRYDKIDLVPFGEYVPEFFSWVNRISQEAGDFVPGTRVVVSPLGPQKEGTFICYESVFPQEVRKFVQGGATVLINISNDGYFGHSDARWQHLAIVRMRAAENRRWILRATNNGVTASIDPAGQAHPDSARLPGNGRRFPLLLRVVHHLLHAPWRLVRLGLLAAGRGGPGLLAASALQEAAQPRPSPLQWSE